MNMADLGKKMMFYLEIQSAQHPEQKFIGGTEIGSGAHLMQSPVANYFFLLRKMIDLHHMRQLKHNTDKQPTDERHYKKSDQGLPAHKVNRDYDKDDGIQYFRCPENEMFFHG